MGGPVFGTAGWAWRRVPRLRGLGAGTLAAIFLAEAVVSYGWRLHYWSSAALFAALGVLAIIALDRGADHAKPATAWLAITLPAGIAAELVLGLVYR